MFKLIKQARSNNDKHTKYDVVLDKEYTVEEFIDAIADGRNGTHGQITIKMIKKPLNHVLIISRVLIIDIVDFKMLKKKLNKYGQMVSG